MDLATPLNGNVLKRISDNRTIMYFGDNFWVIDRPNEKGLVWTANSPIDAWKKMDDAGVCLYGALDGKMNLKHDSSFVLQNGIRSDYVK